MVNGSKSARGDGDIVALLDIGTTKVCCLIARIDGRPGDRQLGRQPMGIASTRGGHRLVRVLGFGHQRSRGIKSGVVINLDEAEQAVRAAVSQAERMAGFNIEEVVLSINCGRLKSLNFKAGIQLDGRAATPSDVGRIMAAGRTYAERDGRSLVHLNKIGFQLDGMYQMPDPCGMAGRRLDADLHAVTADEAPLRNLLLVVERSYLSVSAIVAGPFATGLAATTEDERRLGVTVIDMGGGTTTVALFADGQFLQTDAVAVGGSHITYDIARTLSTPLAEAERIKTLYGNIYGAGSDEHEVISLVGAGGEAGQQATRAQLRMIIQPRAEQLLRLLGERIGQNRLSPYASGRIVLTGGASQLAGLGELAANMLGRATRIGRPAPLQGLPQGVCSPAFSTIIGLVQSLFVPDACVRATADRDVLGAPDGYLERVGQWFRESF